MEDVRLFHRGDFLDAPGQGTDHIPLVEAGQPEQGVATGRRAVEVQAIHRFLGLCAGALLEPSHMDGMPAQGALLTEDVGAAEGVAAVQGDGVVEYVQDAHGCGAHPLTVNWSSRTVAWNISRVHRGAL